MGVKHYILSLVTGAFAGSWRCVLGRDSILDSFLSLIPSFICQSYARNYLIAWDQIPLLRHKRCSSDLYRDSSPASQWKSEGRLYVGSFAGRDAGRPLPHPTAAQKEPRTEPGSPTGISDGEPRKEGVMVRNLPPGRQCATGRAYLKPAGGPQSPVLA